MTKRKPTLQDTPDTPDCRTCGACCISTYDQDDFCDVTEKDMSRMSVNAVRKHVLFPHVFDTLTAALDGRLLPAGTIKTKWRTQRAGPLKGAEICACVFLRGSILHRTSCRIYEKRPEACRNAIKPGNKICQDLRRMLQEKTRRSVMVRLS